MSTYLTLDDPVNGSSAGLDLDGMEPGAALAAIESELQRVFAARTLLLLQRSELPRNDKATAHALLMQINTAQTKIDRLKLLAKEYRVRANRREAHGAWADAVRTVAGQDVLDACFEYMMATKKARRT